jgi:uncharacterized membrane protein
MKSIIKRVLFEEVNNPLKKYWFNKWSKEEESGSIPTFDNKLIQKLGLSNKVKTIEEYYVEYMGGQDRLQRIVSDYFLKNTFTSIEIQRMGISVGGYDFKFRVNDIYFEDEYLEVNINFRLIEGTVQLVMVDDSVHDLKTLTGLDDSTVWEIDLEVKDILKEFVGKVLASFSIDYNDINILWD